MTEMVTVNVTERVDEGSISTDVAIDVHDRRGGTGEGIGEGTKKGKATVPPTL